ELGSLFQEFGASEAIARPAAFLALIVATMVVAWIAAAFIKKVLSLLLLGWVDRAGGVVIGLLLGSVFVSAILFALDVFPMGWAENALTDSSLRPYFGVLTGFIGDISGDLKDLSL